MASLFLASASPRRKDLIEKLGISVLSDGVDADESAGDLSPEEYPLAIALRKMEKANRHPQFGRHLVTVTADTAVINGSTILGKAADRVAAAEMLRELSGKTHSVITGLCVFHHPSETLLSESAETKVTFGTLSDQTLQWYLDSENWRDAAGAYKIQEAGGALVESIEGSPSNVAGLPQKLFYGMLYRLNFPL